MPKRIFDFAEGRGAGLTGTNGIEFTPFDFSTYGFTAVVKFIIEFNCVAIATNETTAGMYTEAHSSKGLYLYNPTGNLSALITNHVFLNDSSDIQWFVTGGTYAKIRAQGNATTRTWNICFTGRILACIEN
jgi:hypothetical protein